MILNRKISKGKINSTLNKAHVIISIVELYKRREKNTPKETKNLLCKYESERSARSLIFDILYAINSCLVRSVVWLSKNDPWLAAAKHSRLNMFVRLLLESTSVKSI